MVRFITPLLALLCASAVIASPTSSQNAGAVYNQVPQQHYQQPGIPQQQYQQPNNRLNKSHKALKYGALGAIAGGFIGHKYNRTMTGAILGGIGGALYGRHKDKQ
ncbi:hypothetical protein IWQ62_001167, partial [Dispira parvispora]